MVLVGGKVEVEAERSPHRPREARGPPHHGPRDWRTVARRPTPRAAWKCRTRRHGAVEKEDGKGGGGVEIHATVGKGQTGRQQAAGPLFE
jgi:hypothetical protein